MIIRYKCLGYRLETPTEREEFSGEADIDVDNAMSISTALLDYIDTKYNLRRHLTLLDETEIL
jgi:hypothetical protein